MNVIVVGAGVAGLAAGQALKKTGATVLILEARNRIGGRVWTDRSFCNFPVENGPEFIHGDRAVTWDYVRELGLETRLLPDSAFAWYDEQGKLRQVEEQTGIPDIEHELTRVPPDAPDQSVRDWVAGLGLSKEARLRSERRLAGPYIAEPDVIGVADLAHEARVSHSGDGNFYLCGGYDRLIRHLADGLEIQLNAVVRRIETGAHGVKVYLENGKRVSAERVIVTVPVSILQQKQIIFDPSLPSDKVNALNHIHMGAVIKLQYLFQKAFWDPGPHFLLGPPGFPVWWSSSSMAGSGPPLLTAWLGAKAAREWDELPEAVAVAHGLAVLEKIYPAARARDKMVKARRISWNSDPWSLGGYTYIPVGGFGARLALARPVGDRLYFAGEAAVTDSNPATVHGALESGMLTARSLLAGPGHQVDP